MSYDITQQAAEKVFESLVENAVDKAMDRAVNFFQRSDLLSKGSLWMRGGLTIEILGKATATRSTKKA
jgi:hypothetical protein